MKALRWHGPRQLRLCELIEPALRREELRIAVSYCGICGSDLHEYLDGPHAIPSGRPHALSGRMAPLTLGHEFCGDVAESSTHAQALRVGTRVVIEPEYRCGRCEFCLSGRYNLCRDMGFVGLMGDGGMADTVVVPAYTAHALPDEVTMEQAAVFEPAAVALHAVRQSNLRAGDACAVFGMGPIGLLIVMMLRQCGAGRIFAVDLSPQRLARGGALGADILVDARSEDAARIIREQTAGSGAAIAFEAGGSQSTLDGALDSLRKGGEAVLVGLMGRASIDVFLAVNRELRIVTSVGYRDVYPTLIEWTAQRRIDPSLIVSRVVSLEDAVTEGFDALVGDKDLIKVLVRPGRAP